VLLVFFLKVKQKKLKLVSGAVDGILGAAEIYSI
jgi:hypothetical protein